METKALSFVLASWLLVTAWAIVPPPDVRPHSHPLIKATPAHPPEKPQAPCPPPENHHYHHHAPKKAPVHAPDKHHYTHAPKYECKSRCEEHCKKDHHKKEKQEEEEKCVKACITCCCGSKHAPGHKKECKWSHMKMEGKRMKCY